MSTIDPNHVEIDRIIANLNIEKFQLLGQWPQALDGLIQLAIAEINNRVWAEARNQLNAAGKIIADNAPTLDAWRAEWHVVWAYYHAQRCDGNEMHKHMDAARRLEGDNAPLGAVLAQIEQIFGVNCRK